MLGIGALTRDKIPLAEAEFAPWGVVAAKAGRHHSLGAKLLMQFRRSLLRTQKAWDAVIECFATGKWSMKYSNDVVSVTRHSRR